MGVLVVLKWRLSLGSWLKLHAVDSLQLQRKTLQVLPPPHHNAQIFSGNFLRNFKGKMKSRLEDKKAVSSFLGIGHLLERCQI